MIRTGDDEGNSRRRREIGTMVSGNSTNIGYVEEVVFPDSAKLTPPVVQNDVKESKKAGDYYEYIYEELSVNKTVFVLKELKHFSSYSISVRACREGKNDNCSNDIIIQQRTARIGKRSDENKQFRMFYIKQILFIKNRERWQHPAVHSDENFVS